MIKHKIEYNEIKKLENIKDWVIKLIDSESFCF